MLIIKIVRKGNIFHLVHKGIFQEKNDKPKPAVLPEIFLFVPQSVFPAKGLPNFFFP
jgi:hypothetical protein